MPDDSDTFVMWLCESEIGGFWSVLDFLAVCRLKK